MTYAEALQRMADGGYVCRPHWCQVLLVRGEKDGTYVLEHDDGKREPFLPYDDDCSTDDWEEHFGFESGAHA